MQDLELHARLACRSSESKRSISFKESEDTVGTIIDFAREEKIGLLVLGQPTRHGLVGRISPGIVIQTLERMAGFDILVVES